jgi:peptidoglycan L-alanyl-D-glutamate endopeptidase CwlK
MDKITESRINLLHPKVRDEVTKIINEANAILTQHSQVRIVQGLRTIEEQDGLYALGRTKPGKRVTNAKGGSSFHNYGLAIDFCLLIDGKEISWDMAKDYDEDKKADWTEVVEIFKKYGWEWGGNWSSIKDYPHFQKVFGNSWQTLLDRYKNKDFVPNTRYVRI